ncbi:hypothetical protein HK102_001738 [Quaeritorhiza haematococci]|nr:hypothetical protein HK102_001738 [Quaeritorhiza haematococci]
MHNQVIAICTHINKRLKSNPNLAIPTAKVLDLFNSQTSSSLVQNFALIYLEMGFGRGVEEQANALAPSLVQGISSRNQAQQQSIFQIALPIISQFKEYRPDRLKPAVNDPFGFESRSDDAKFLLEKFLDVILYAVPSSSGAKGGNSGNTSNQGETSTTSEKPAEPAPPAGLSKAAVQFITAGGKATWAKSVSELKLIKLGLLRFITTPTLFPTNLLTSEKFLVYVAASADPLHEVVSAGEDGLRRHAKPDFEDEQLVNCLYQLYQGTAQSSPPQGAAGDNVRMPGTVSLKSRALAYLLKSAKAANTFPSMLQVTFDALYGEQTTAKLRAAGMSFVQWIARMAETSRIEPVAPVLLMGLQKFIGEHEGEAGQEIESLRGFAYEAVGLLSTRAPALFRKDVTILYSFFQAVSKEQRNVRVSVLEALSMMVEAYKDFGRDEGKRKEIEAVLMANVEKVEHQARFAAVKYANALFPFSHPTARYICLLASGDQKLEVREEARRGLRFPSPPPTTSTSTTALEEYRSQLPSFHDTASLLHAMSKRSVANVIRAPGTRFVGGYAAEAYTHVLEFLRALLIRHSDPYARGVGEEVGIMAEEETKIVEEGTRRAVKDALRRMWEAESMMEVDGDGAKKGETGLGFYLRLIETALKADEAGRLLVD